MITRKNYEIYFIEYLDGTLSEAKAAELKTFLLLNPDLSALLEDTDKAKLKAPVLIYRKKNVLKKTEIQECPDYYAIATAETVLTPEENQQLGKRKSDQNFQKLVNTYRQFKVKPDKNIRFEKKKALYHKPAYGKLIIRISAAAAIVMLMISMGRFLIHRSSHSRQRSENRAGRDYPAYPCSVTGKNNCLTGQAQANIPFCLSAKRNRQSRLFIAFLTDKRQYKRAAK